MAKRWKYFREDENGVPGLNVGLVDMLDKARSICGFPITITSGHRTEEQNKKIGGTEESSHIKGLAVDLRVPNDLFLKKKLIWALGLAGFKRIGIYDKHIHVDIDNEKPQFVAWGGASK